MVDGYGKIVCLFVYVGWDDGSRRDVTFVPRTVVSIVAAEKLRIERW